MIGKDPVNTDQLDYLFEEDFDSLFSGDSSSVRGAVSNVRLSVEYKIATDISSTSCLFGYALMGAFFLKKINTKYTIDGSFGVTNERITYKVVAGPVVNDLYAYYNIGLVQPPLNAFIIDSTIKEGQ